MQKHVVQSLPATCPQQSSESAGSSIWSTLKGKVLGDKPAAAKALNGSVINVMTVASGHMYERLQKIMILSVVKNTKARCVGGAVDSAQAPA